MAETISRAEYTSGRYGCATPDSVRTGFFAVLRERLRPGDEETFARELFVKILDVEWGDVLPRIQVEHLEDDGTSIGKSELLMDVNGAIMGADWNENGYLLGQTEPDYDGQRMAKKMLYAPVIGRHAVVVEEPARVMARPLPE